ncbi:sigma-70 family RNA polymerase sigma factor [Streptomyces gardneri]|uniref:sigma-70 family RNA polymerase sigma factor n=1 Tax=Nocardia TaxID=1817 RepID=UPI00135C75FE|nr:MULTISPECIES: sigma-70 family RNA polymerase sigma factor [Nocardia]MBF6168832.1 sigma-70 family RNA polymerase sigma factor [Streptomyces gardneri]MBF6208668.1 sigma-70 family RNA polymerase sigma factor [Streptomyces gardneri]UAK30834.1 sigma-70 family RNA polymerase sigma factor [Nocardia asteroides]
MSQPTATTATTPQPHPGDLDQLWRRFSGDLRAFIARRVSRPEDADDILSIVFLRMARSLDDLREQGRLLGWMYAITRNAITDYYRSAAHRRELPVDAVPDNPSAHGDELESDAAAEKELASCLVPMLAGLPAEQAAAVKMVDLDARTHAAAAGEAGISVSGMKSRVQRGRAALQARLRACCQISQDRTGHVHDYQPRDGACGGAASSDGGCGCGATPPSAP